ncbi:MAG TPA: hypothetical protein PK453_04450 [Leptospiraceae bacterium]|nr:hypothetical protein [Leptospiraceae bacterium]
MSENPSDWGDYRISTDFAHGQLICRLVSNEQSKYFSMGNFQSHQSGFIECRMNDFDIKNNSGKVSITFQVTNESVPEASDTCGQEKFLNAVRSLNFFNVKNSIRNSCNLNTEAKDGNTLAVFLLKNHKIRDSKKILKYLLFYGLDVNYKSSFTGSSAILEAAKYGDLETFKILIDYKADWTVKDNEGNTLNSILQARREKAFSEYILSVQKSIIDTKGVYLIEKKAASLNGFYFDEQNISALWAETQNDITIFRKLKNINELPSDENTNSRYRLRLLDSNYGAVHFSPDQNSDLFFTFRLAKDNEGRTAIQISEHKEYSNNTSLQLNKLIKSELLTKRIPVKEELKINEISSENKVCAAFSIGGAEGLIHSGALYAFDFLKIRPACIFGTSMGSIIGGIYAKEGSGEKSLKLIRRFINDYTNATKEEAMGNAIVFGTIGYLICPWCALGGGVLGAKSTSKLDIDRFIRVLDNNLEGVLIKDLSIPYSTMTLEVSNITYKYFRSGKLSEAIRGSIANPVLFEKMEIKNQLDPGVDRSAVVPIMDTFEVFSPDFVVALNASGKDPYYFNVNGLEKKVLQIKLLKNNEVFDIEKIFTDEKYLNGIITKGFLRSLEMIVEY